MECLEKNDVKVPKNLVYSTLEEIQKAGMNRQERLVLWLGKNTSSDKVITEIFIPQQISDVDYFHLSSESMKNTLRYLRERRLKIIMQVHSHPADAFHSAADSRWAIIRHEGALSLVIPYFGFKTNENNFFEGAALFRLSKNNIWLQIPGPQISEVLTTT